MIIEKRVTTSFEPGYPTQRKSLPPTRALTATRVLFVGITLLLSLAYLFCHGCHAGDHDDELMLHWLDRDR